MTLPSEDDPDLGPAKSFLEHLDDLRRALVWSALAVAAGMVAAGFCVPRIFVLLKAPLAAAGQDPDTFLVPLELTGGVSVAMQAILWGGILFSAPFVLAAIAWFVFPGLTRPERRAVTGGVCFAACLFITGVVLGYLLALPPGIRMMLWFYDWLGFPVKFVTLTSYVGFCMKLLLAFGLAFELPVVVLVLGHLGIVSSDQLRDKRRHAIVVVLILAAVITPTQDPITQLLLAGPLIALYELCVWLVWAKERRMARPAARQT